MGKATHNPTLFECLNVTQLNIGLAKANNDPIHGRFNRHFDANAINGSGSYKLGLKTVLPMLAIGSDFRLFLIIGSCERKT
jgi:hypothetical protein